MSIYNVCPENIYLHYLSLQNYRAALSLPLYSKKMTLSPPVHQPSWSTFDPEELKLSRTGEVEYERETITMQTGESWLVPEE